MGIIKYLDDLLYLTGVGLLTHAGFLIHPSLGFAVLGAGLIYFARLTAKSGL